jgi:hypothetical protein
MKTKIISLLAVTITAALISQPMFANTTYVYTGNPFTTAVAPYSTNDFVTAMVTLASPLGANMPLTQVTRLAFSLSDGVETITDQTLGVGSTFDFATGPTGKITEWYVAVDIFPFPTGEIRTRSQPGEQAYDWGISRGQEGSVFDHPGTWTTGAPSAPDAGSSLALLSLSLTALGVTARQFKRGSGLTAPGLAEVAFLVFRA